MKTYKNIHFINRWSTQTSIAPDDCLCTWYSVQSNTVLTKSVAFGVACCLSEYVQFHKLIPF